MKFNHLIVGAKDLDLSVKFFEEFLGFKSSKDSSYTGQGRILRLKDLEVLFVPMDEELLPNPVHVALEAESYEKFDELFSKALDMKLCPRSLPPLHSSPGKGKVINENGDYDIFYVLDPSGLNLEILVKK